MNGERTIAAIHASGHELVLEFTGAGSLALAWLHSVAGSSRTILEATDRYAETSLRELIRDAAAKPVSPATASAMAERAYLRACRLGKESRPCLGAGCTATIATDHAKRGEHRCCIAVQDSLSVTTLDLVLAKGKRERAEEEELVATLLINAIAQRAGVTEILPVNLLNGEQVTTESRPCSDPLAALWHDEVNWVVIEPDGRRVVESQVSGVVCCGSFNPLHFGHEAMAAATGQPVTFELAAINAEKLPMTRGELERRLAQFAGRYRVVVTRSPLFVDKAKFFPGCTFLLGFDTAARLIDKRFYQGSEALRDQALATIAAAGCSVLVAGRVHGGVFKTLDDLAIPAGAEKLFAKLPEFRADISATQLRGAGHAC